MYSCLCAHIDSDTVSFPPASFIFSTVNGERGVGLQLHLTFTSHSRLYSHVYKCMCVCAGVQRLHQYIYITLGSAVVNIPAWCYIHIPMYVCVSTCSVFLTVSQMHLARNACDIVFVCVWCLQAVV